MKKRKVIIDCDPGIDDSLAIMLALKSPEIEVIGITMCAEIHRWRWDLEMQRKS